MAFDMSAPSPDQAAETLAQQAMAALPAAFACFDATGRLRFANVLWRQWLIAPYDPDGGLLADAQRVVRAALRRADLAEPYTIEREILCADDRRRYLSFHCSRSNNENACRLTLAGFDMTTAHAAELALRDREEMLKLAMHGPNEGLWEWDAVTKDLRLSARLLSILGFSGETIHTTSHEWLKLVHPEDRRRYEAAVTAHLKGCTEHFECEYRVMDRNGAYRWMLARGLAQRGADGLCRRMVGSIGDITLRKQAELGLLNANEELERRVAERTHALTQEIAERARAERDLLEAKEQAEVASRAKSEFLANMSHELRTPLNAIIGFSDMTAAQMLGPIGNPKYVEYARLISGSAQHLLAIISDLLDLAKIEAGRFRIDPMAMDIAAAADESLSLMAERAQAGGVALVRDIAGNLPPVWGDPVRIKQIFLNLLSNALKFTPRGGEVRLRLRPGDGETDDAAQAAQWVTATVSDTGCGMSPADLVVAMEPFGQVDNHLTRRVGGAGLGLPLTRSFVELHGGRFHIASQPGQGVTVRVALPVARPEE